MVADFPAATPPPAQFRSARPHDCTHGAAIVLFGLRPCMLSATRGVRQVSWTSQAPPRSAFNRWGMHRAQHQRHTGAPHTGQQHSRSSRALADNARSQ